MTGAGRTRVLVVDDHVLFADSLTLALSLESHDALTVAPGDFGSVAALLSRIHRFRPGIVLLDLDLGSLGDGRRLIEPLTRSGVQVVVVTGSTDRGRWGECLDLGARQVLSKSGPLSSILATIRAIGRGSPVISAEERRELIALAREQSRERLAARERLERLSRREAVVLGRLLRGETVRQVADALVVSEGTVRSQVKAILAKLEVSSQIAAVGLANRVGWRPPA
ncbi:response regulator transcription factor [Nocardioides albidus]|uniref:response regulator transcription factor n=1 Tax=Nocardioides albidus TaxID=1517589 RepID=UPI001F002CB7|nr:response regulator transcription factor [Nocardioides albidus]